MCLLFLVVVHLPTFVLLGMKLWVSVQVDCLFGEDAIESLSLLRLRVRKQNSTPSSKWDCRKEFDLILELSSDKDLRTTGILGYIATRSSWLNCALRDDEAAYWVSIGYYEAVAVGNWWYWVSRGHLRLYMTHSQMLGKIEYTLPAKFWRLVGCTEMLSW